MLDLEYARGEAFLGIVVHHRHHTLDQYRTIIQFRTHQVNGAAVDSDARLEGTGVGVQPLERRKERGVDVEEPVMPARNEPRSEDAHETGEADELDIGVFKRYVQRPLKCLSAVMIFVVDHQISDAGCIGVCQAAGAAPAGDNEHNVISRIRMPASVDQSFQVGATPRD